jgi:hypothetical protein
VSREWERRLGSLRAFMRDFGPFSRCVELDGVVASVTPSVPDRSLPNSVIYEDEERLEAALPELAALYDDEGVRAWTVWVPPGHERALRALEAAGHARDAQPMRRALADARERGCDVSTLEATVMGRPVYERLGYRVLGTLEMWERRRAAPAG